MKIKFRIRKLRILLKNLPHLKRWYLIQARFLIKYNANQLFGITLSVKKIHHHVPQLLLRYFSSRKGMIYKRDSKTFQSREVSISKHAGNIKEQYFFKNKKTGKNDQIIEDLYGMLENESAFTLNKIRSDEYLFENYENLMLSHFVSSLIIRNPIFKEFIGLSLSFFNQVNSNYGKIKLRTIDDIFIKNKYGFSKDILNGWAKEYDKNKHQKLLNSSMIASVFLLSQIARHIHFCEINIFTISQTDYDAGLYFIISDNPVLTANKNFMPKLPFYPPIDLTDVQLILPISPTRAISMALWNKGGIFKANKELIRQINALSLKNSPEFSYSHRDHASLEKQFKPSA